MARKLSAPRAIVAPHMRGAGSRMADALSRCVPRAENRDPYPERHRREKSRDMVTVKCGRMYVDVAASDPGGNDWAKVFGPRPTARFKMVSLTAGFAGFRLRAERSWFWVGLLPPVRSVGVALPFA